MKSITVGFIAFGCASTLPAPSAEAVKWKPLYSFCSQANCVDGARPRATVIDLSGDFYGTTEAGGADNKGTIFKLAPDGAEAVVHSFSGYPKDGEGPFAGLIADKNGNGYGTTVVGGSHNFGTVFKLASDGTETALYSFTCTGSDGCSPFGGVIKDGGNLYGTTLEGGYYDDSECGSGCGIVFKLAPDGRETVLHEFKGPEGPDGAFPWAGLVRDKAGNLYGTTANGGGNGGDLGTVFKLAPDGTETFPHNFAGGTDGADPQAPLIMDKTGNLYGTTVDGGSAGCNQNLGCGTVFMVAPDGTEKVLHAFAGGSDGAHPQAGLLMDKAGNLYGTTYYGGGGARCPAGGCGTVFKLTPDGTETVIHACASGKSGRGPEAGLVADKKGNLYGTTFYGGANRSGMVFELKQ